MSLVSRTSRELKKRFEEVANNTTLGSVGQELNSEGKPNPNNLSRKRRKENAASSGEKDSKVEQEKEMKRLENFLFGTIYSPLEFGKEVVEDREEGLGLGKPLFVVNKSTNNEIETYEGEFNEEREPLSGDREDRVEMGMSTGNQIVVHEEELNKERKPVWVDEEEFMTKVDIMKVPRLRKLRKEAGEGLISGTDYVSRLRAQHSRLNPGTEWAHIDRKSERVCDSDNDSDDESGITVAPGYERVGSSDDILRSNDELVVKDNVKLLPGRLLEYSRLMDANGKNLPKVP